MKKSETEPFKNIHIGGEQRRRMPKDERVCCVLRGEKTQIRESLKQKEASCTRYYREVQ